MHADRTAYELELLAHFDGPDATRAVDDEQKPPHALPVRGIGWVLQCAAALAVLFVSVCTLAQFGYCLAAELALERAARAGVLEATLPRATYQSVVASVDRRLTGYSLPPSGMRLGIRQNSAPAGRYFRAAEGDRLSVTLTVSTDAVLPAWLRKVNFWREDSQIVVRMARQKPGRKLPPPPSG